MDLSSFLDSLNLLSRYLCLQFNHDNLCYKYIENETDTSFIKSAFINLATFFFYLKFINILILLLKKKNLDLQMFEIKMFQCSSRMLTKK